MASENSREMVIKVVKFGTLQNVYKDDLNGNSWHIRDKEDFLLSEICV